MHLINLTSISRPKGLEPVTTLCMLIPTCDSSLKKVFVLFF